MAAKRCALPHFVLKEESELPFMKQRFALFFALLLSSMLIFTACQSAEESSGKSSLSEQSEEVESIPPTPTPDPSPSLPEENSSEESSSESSSDLSSQTEEEKVQVEVSVSYFGDTEFSEIEEDAEKYGAISVEKTGDKTYLYTFYKSDYEIFLKNLKANVRQSVEKLNDDDDFDSVYSLSINEELTLLTIYAESISYGSGNDEVICKAVWNLVCLYDEFAGLEKTPIDVEVYDGDMDILAYTSVYPESKESDEE